MENKLGFNKLKQKEVFDDGKKGLQENLSDKVNYHPLK